MLVVIGPVQIVYFDSKLHIEIPDQIFQMRTHSFKCDGTDRVFDIIRTPRQQPHIKMHHPVLWPTIGNNNIFKRG